MHESNIKCIYEAFMLWILKYKKGKTQKHYFYASQLSRKMQGSEEAGI